jgi:hypothetical protein
LKRSASPVSADSNSNDSRSIDLAPDIEACSIPLRRADGLHTSETDPHIIADTADYIAKMSAELGSLAQSAKLELLAYFLDMARLEAISHVRALDGKILK